MTEQYITDNYIDLSYDELLYYDYDRPSEYFKKIGNENEHFFGLEIECEVRTDEYEDAWNIVEKMNKAPLHWVAKRDGSLCEDTGLELECLPTTQKELQSCFEVLEAHTDILRGYHAYNAGLHVNMDNDLSPLNTQKLIRLLVDDKMQELIEVVGQRSLDNSYCYRVDKDQLSSTKALSEEMPQPTSRYGVDGFIEALENYVADVKKISKDNTKIKINRFGILYKPSYILHSPTGHCLVGFKRKVIEFRFFRSNLTKARLNKALEFCTSLIEFVRKKPVSLFDTEHIRDDYLRFIADNYNHYPNLIRFLLEHNNVADKLVGLLPLNCLNIITNTSFPHIVRYGNVATRKKVQKLAANEKRPVNKVSSEG
jgi:hypothetical protein